MWNQIDRSLIKLWNYLNTHKSSHWITTLLRNPEHEEDHQQLVRAVFLIIFSFLFLLISFNVATESWLTHWNEPIYQFLQSLRTKTVDDFMIAMTCLGEKYVLFIISSLVLIYLAWKKRWWTVLHLFVITLLGTASIGIFKRLIYSPRPPIIMVSDSSSSFPSGHTILSICVFGFLAVLLADNLPHGKKKYVYYSAVTLVLLIAFSRLYLGAHWLSDIIGSIFLGMCLILFITLSYRRRSLTKIPAITLATIIVSVGGIAWLGYAYIYFKPTQQEFTQIWPIQYFTEKHWWQQAPGEIDFYRLGRTGHPSQPLNIQWHEYLDKIQSQLKEKGWQSHSAHIDLGDTVGHFVTIKQQRRLPFIPTLYHNRAPKLFMTKDLGPNRPIVILRLWESDILINGGKVPLWIGTVNYYQPPLKLLSLPEKQSRIFNSALELLIPDLTKYEWKQVQTILEESPPEIAESSWDGTVLLIKPQK
jgi:membrane-associated phospholipid phosphatase